VVSRVGRSRRDESTPRGRLGQYLLASALLGVAACGSSCEHQGEAKSRDLLAEPLQFDAAALAERLWPIRAEGRFQAVPGTQLDALGQLVILLLDHAEAGELDRRDRRRARVLADFARVELLAVEIGALRLWVVTESADRVRGVGSYVIRLGPAQPVLLSAPHSFHDQGTGDIGLDLLLEASEASATPRALFVNSVHRHRQLDGRKVALADNPADSANVADHPLASVTRRALEHAPLTIIQLHGFARDDAAGDPIAILSSSRSRPSAYLRALASSLRAGLPEFEFGVFGVDVDRLGGTKNTQARAAREFDRCFAHFEMARELRDRLVDDRQLRARLGRALILVPKDPSDCR